MSGVGIVVPTLGTRPDFLVQCVKSIRSAGACTIAVVRPPDVDLGDEVRTLVDTEVDDPGTGLAAAINVGLRAFPSDVSLVNWLGDDDRLTPGSLVTAASWLASSDAVGVFGQCRYIDEDGHELWVNRSGSYSVALMRVGPQLIPQPGSLFSREAFERCGGLREDLSWAFDLDLFLKLRRLGQLRFIPEVLAEFRWHPGSLSVGGRLGSVTEASKVRIERHPVPIRQMSRLWEPLVKQIILLAGKQMNRRMSARAQTS